MKELMEQWFQDEVKKDEMLKQIPKLLEEIEDLKEKVRKLENGSVAH